MCASPPWTRSWSLPYKTVLLANNSSIRSESVSLSYMLFPPFNSVISTTAMSTSDSCVQQCQLYRVCMEIFRRHVHCTRHRTQLMKRHVLVFRVLDTQTLSWRNRSLFDTCIRCRGGMLCMYVSGQLPCKIFLSSPIMYHWYNWCLDPVGTRYISVHPMMYRWYSCHLSYCSYCSYHLF